MVVFGDRGLFVAKSWRRPRRGGGWAHQRVGERAAEDAPDVGSDDATAGGEGGTGADGVQHEVRVVEVAHLRHTPCKERKPGSAEGAATYGVPNPRAVVIEARHALIEPERGRVLRAQRPHHAAGVAEPAVSRAAPRGFARLAHLIDRRGVRRLIYLHATPVQLIRRPANRRGNQPN